MRVELTADFPTGAVASLLSSIRSAPKLSSVTFSFTGVRSTLQEFPASGSWTVVDKWLARVGSERTGAEDGLCAVMAGWPEDNPNWEGYFPEFRRAGGKVGRETHDYEYWDPRAISQADVWRNGP